MFCSTKRILIFRFIFIAFCIIFGIVGLFKFSESLFITCVLLVVLGTIFFAIHILLLVKYLRLAKVCTVYTGNYVEFVSTSIIGFSSIRVKFMVGDEEKTMDSLRVHRHDRHPLVFKKEQLSIGYSPSFNYIIIL